MPLYLTNSSRTGIVGCSASLRSPSMLQAGLSVSGAAVDVFGDIKGLTTPSASAVPGIHHQPLGPCFDGIRVEVRFLLYDCPDRLASVIFSEISTIIFDRFIYQGLIRTLLAL